MRQALRQPYRQFFGTLANQVRLEIIEFLSQGTKNVTSIVEALPYEQSTVSHSLKRLEECGFVTVKRKGKERYYELNNATIKPLLKMMHQHMDAYCKCVVARKEEKNGTNKTGSQRDALQELQDAHSGCS
ncbi:winged helix-turn-helix transcriptional regulator [Candidatus Woesearchaeota archaeon]|nr:MAG: ArsR family transcriptional regulator [archaeon GW2011_AR4]MBS3129035.1 winged helix-turn-helix transcriptional regulator [Candidatus Woesearchaeota archaeon]HIH37769.1 winged helix-turn-helix transcriptional regulator [Candidatus Woesearchaeota archaeon]HIJ03894.1 winged helix-turn-helix transcriptional regulator [Candidatus Woesearchaeota archaeon]